MKKCRHENRCRLIWQRCCGAMVVAEPEEIPSAIRCLDCGHYLSLGPARMTPESAIELRAAEIAADGPRGVELYYSDRSAWFGWCQHVAIHEYNNPTAGVAENEWAGYLARQIVHGGNSDE